MPDAEKDAGAPLCSECGMSGQCAACYLMEQQGVTPHNRVPPPGGSDA